MITINDVHNLRTIDVILQDRQTTKFINAELDLSDDYWVIVKEYKSTDVATTYLSRDRLIAIMVT